MSRTIYRRIAITAALLLLPLVSCGQSAGPHAVSVIHESWSPFVSHEIVDNNVVVFYQVSLVDSSEMVMIPERDCVGDLSCYPPVPDNLDHYTQNPGMWPNIIGYHTPGTSFMVQDYLLINQGAYTHYEVVLTDSSGTTYRLRDPAPGSVSNLVFQ